VPADREAAENELTRALVALPQLPSGLAAELDDAEQRVMISRQVYNDAVRDTLALRGTRLVRWLRLAGNAAAPHYFDIAEEHLGSSAAAAGTPVDRPAARVLLLDDADRVLLFEGADPARAHEPFWFTVGGAIDGGEDPRAAAVREVREETGLELNPEDLVGPVWQRDVIFSFDGTSYSSHEWFFVARSGGHAVDTSGFDDVEAATVLRLRWWSAEELGGTTAAFYPLQLAELLPTVTNGWDGVTRTIR
jgi:8-oxo-dGTP pyrophosphatase MutT (NUDIX family)